MTTKPKERPIVFSDEMVRAILDGRKSQTRRTTGLDDVNVAARPGAWEDVVVAPLGYMTKQSAKGKFGAMFRSFPNAVEAGAVNFCPAICPFGAPGERLWVRESIVRWLPCEGRYGIRDTAFYSADCAPTKLSAWPWKRSTLPAAGCPRGLSRITLEITSVRVERLQEISEEDAVNEGIERITHIGPCRAMGWRDYTGGAGFMSPIESYRTLWNQLNNKSGRRWEDNLWVWALDLKRVTP